MAMRMRPCLRGTFRAPLPSGQQSLASLWFRYAGGVGRSVPGGQRSGGVVRAMASMSSSRGTTTYPPPNKPLVNPVLDPFRARIAQHVQQTLGMEEEHVLSALEATRQAGEGHTTLLLPRLGLGKRLQEGREALLKSFQADEFLEGIGATGAFVNYRLNERRMRDTLLPHIAQEGERYGRNEVGQGQRVVVEFSSPNIAKPFHAGHLRSTIIGSFIRNVHDACGYETIAMNYLGDWGKQYGLLAVGFSRYGNAEKLVKDPIKHLYEVYVAINKEAETHVEIHEEARAYFRRMEEGDEEALGQWRRFRDLSIKQYKETYDRLHIHFDAYSGESQVEEGMRQAVRKLKEMGILRELEGGAKGVDLEEEGLGKTVVEKRDGTTLYLTRDIGAAVERYETYGFDRMFYVVGRQQELHLRQLFCILGKMGYTWSKKCEHVAFGMVQGMSTRRGNVVFLEEMLARAKEVMLGKMHEGGGKVVGKGEGEEGRVADELALSAIVIQDLSGKRGKDYAFEWSRMLSFEGDTGPYLQYTHARLCSLEDLALEGREGEGEGRGGREGGDDLGLLKEKEALSLVATLAQYPDQVLQAQISLEACVLVQYGLRIGHEVNGLMRGYWVKGQAEPVARARLLLYRGARITLGNILRMLGLKPLTRV
ncbi:MAG: hypothetical protein DHS80DRAFT_27419 [Piptocephalis tieghemiana]|nr:MAG: hypothetical protein DHS80DRAFT_27419 [Piptocephalis tieghemiana]